MVKSDRVGLVELNPFLVTREEIWDIDVELLKLCEASCGVRTDTLLMKLQYILISIITAYSYVNTYGEKCSTLLDPSDGVLICLSRILELYSPGPNGKLSFGTRLSLTSTCSTHTGKWTNKFRIKINF